jgi:DHA1 family bicyclomycin/chloramphenicol resistance-like MFS transporter
MQKRTLWLLGALNMIGPFTYDAYLAALPQMSKDLGTNTAGTQWTIIGNLLGMTVGMMFAGSISDAIGRRKPILFSLALYVVASFFIVSAQSIELVIALRLLQGLAGGALISVSQAMVRDHTDGKDSARAYSVLLLIKSIAPILAPLVGAFIILSADWRAIFIFLTLLGVGLLVWAYFAVQDSLADHHKVKLSFASMFGSWGSIFRDRVFIASGLASFFTGFALFAYFSTATFALQADFGLTPFDFGLFMAVNGLALVVFRSINTRLLGRLEFDSVYRIGVLIGLACAVVLLVSAVLQTNFWFFSIGLFLMTGSIGFIGPNALHLALVNHKRNAGAAAGLSGFIGQAAGFISMTLVALVIGTSSIGLAIYIAIPMALTVTSLWLYKKQGAKNA